MKRYLSPFKKESEPVDHFHFVADYNDLVRHLIATNDRKTAMSLAVGGNWDKIGKKLSLLAQDLGLKSGMNVLDFACGSGRFAHYLSKDVEVPRYVGIDVVQELLDYADEICPDHYEFILNRSLSLPVEDNAFDYAFGFSIFTHLLQTEIKIYSDEVNRSLKPGGIFIYSFLEMHLHTNTLETSAAMHLAYGKPYPHLNIFLSRDQVTFLAELTGFEVVKFVEPTDAIGQSVVVLKKLG